MLFSSSVENRKIVYKLGKINDTLASQLKELRIGDSIPCLQQRVELIPKERCLVISLRNQQNFIDIKKNYFTLSILSKRISLFEINFTILPFYAKYKIINWGSSYAYLIIPRLGRSSQVRLAQVRQA